MLDFAPWELIVPDEKSRQLLLKGALGSRPRSRVPPGRSPAAGACTLPDCNVAPGRIAGRELYIVYEDARGCETERGITLRHITPHPAGQHLVHAFCHERFAPRAFRADRVVECYDPETGEQLDFPALLAGMMRRDWQVDRADLEDFVRVLVFMAYCDGRLASEEVGAIDDWLSRFVLRLDGTDQDFEQAQRFARSAAIEGIDYLAALRRLTQGSNAAAVCHLAIQALQDVAEADFELSTEEANWHAVAMRTIRRAAML